MTLLAAVGYTQVALNTFFIENSRILAVITHLIPHAIAAKLVAIARRTDRVHTLALKGGEPLDLHSLALGHVLAAELALCQQLFALAWTSLAHSARWKWNDLSCHRTPALRKSPFEVYRFVGHKTMLLLL